MVDSLSIHCNGYYGKGSANPGSQLSSASYLGIHPAHDSGKAIDKTYMHFGSLLASSKALNNCPRETYNQKLCIPLDIHICRLLTYNTIGQQYKEEKNETDSQNN